MQKLNTYITILLTSADKELLEKIAEEKRLASSSYARSIILNAIKQEDAI